MTQVMAFESSLGDPHPRGRQSALLIRGILDNMQQMNRDLDAHRNKRRSDPPATLALRPARDLSNQHHFANFESLLHTDTDFQRGEL